MNNDISVHEPSERVKALRDAAAAVCPYCEAGKSPNLHKNFFVQWWHDAFHPCPASPIHDLIEQEIAAALTKTLIPESDNTGPFIALQMLAEEARVIYEILAQDGLPRGKYPTFLETIEKAEKYTIKRWKRDDPGFAERHVAEGVERVRGEIKNNRQEIRKQLLQLNIDPIYAQDLSRLRLALEAQGFTASDHNIFIAWKAHSWDSYLSAWFGTEGFSSKQLAHLLLVYMKPAAGDEQAGGEAGEPAAARDRA